MMEVSVVDYMGTDLSVVNAARVSLSKESHFEFDSETWDEYLSEKDTKLIKSLARDGHMLPFRHPHISMRVSAPIFVARQLGKHQVGFTWSEESRRYIEDDPEFFEPSEWRFGDKKIKQGSLGAVDSLTSSVSTDILKRVHNEALEAYRRLLKFGVAREQARMVLPQTMMTQWIWTGSLLAWAHLYRLRVHPHAQAETRDLVAAMGEAIEPLFPVAWTTLTQKDT